MKIKHYLGITTFTIICGMGILGHAQEKAFRPFSPNPEEMSKRYLDASSLDSAARNIAVNTDITPKWSPDKQS
ncbi:MAG: hypothetical protein EOO88_52060, partial [Pedobacter sp.]